MLVIAGPDDFWLPELLVRASAELIGEQAEVRILDDIGHYPMFEDPPLLARLIDEFVRGGRSFPPDARGARLVRPRCRRRAAGRRRAR